MRRTVKTTVVTIGEWVNGVPTTSEITMPRIKTQNELKVAKIVNKYLNRAVSIVARRDEIHCFVLADEIFFKYAKIDDSLLGKDDNEDESDTEDIAD